MIKSYKTSHSYTKTPVIPAPKHRVIPESQNTCHSCTKTPCHSRVVLSGILQAFPIKISNQVGDDKEERVISKSKKPKHTRVL